MRQKLRAAASEIAKTGDMELVGRMRAALLALGDEEKELEKLAHTWEKSAASAKPVRAARTAAAGKLRRELAPLVARLPREEEPRRSELARWIVVLDAEQPAAQEVLGRKRQPDGEWLDDEGTAWRSGAGRVADLVRAAGALALEFERGTSDNPALLAVCGGGNVVRAHGIELHSARPVESLERILGQALRAAALSFALLHGDVRIPELPPWRMVLLTSEEQYRPAVDEALAGGGLTLKDQAHLRQLDLHSFRDSRGWETARWCIEPELSAVLLWRMQSGFLPIGVQPCLSAGHLNWVCLRFLGTSKPAEVWREDPAAPSEERTMTRKDENELRRARWRAARQTLWGCRSWMVAEARAGRDPPWARAMLDQQGKVRDEELLKTTVVCEFLQDEGRLLEVMSQTSEQTPAAPAFEKALGEPLPEFEARWRRWLLQDGERGVVQELERDAGGPDSPLATALTALNAARGAALAGQSPEVANVELDPELSRAAELHARYLALHPEQKNHWPEALEEYAGADGFTPEGTLAGGRAVIAYDGDPALAVRQWLGTFYHRLPLLSPGLIGVGLAVHEEIVVLDAGSLVLAPGKDHVVVWPLPDAEDVPRRLTPELPNPVPGAEMSELGYAITLQLFFADPKGRTSATLELFSGDPQPKNAVDCHVITPEAPLFVDLVPENAWALIPKRPLAKATRYTARASWGKQTKQWSFRTAD